jgi:membrane-bound metal-dependent hydrolase YbcI (DUF457 family)
MFIGHAAVALAAKPRVPGRSLGILMAAAFLIDLVWPVLLLLGVESVLIRPGDTAFTPLSFVSYPWSHSLLAVVAWAVVFAFLALRGQLRPLRDVLWLSGLVVSHWLLDALTHRPDLPLTPGASPVVGLGLWNSIPATFIVEGGLFAVGLAIYLRGTRAIDRIGTAAFWSLMVLLVVIWASGPFSPPPPSQAAIGVVGLAMWLIPLWAHWADRHRQRARQQP